MKAAARLRSWMRSAFHRSRLEHQLDDELRFHVDSCAADLQARGLSPQEAYRPCGMNSSSDSPGLRTQWLR
jgi:hypothetical protein